MWQSFSDFMDPWELIFLGVGFKYVFFMFTPKIGVDVQFD